MVAVLLLNGLAMGDSLFRSACDRLAGEGEGQDNQASALQLLLLLRLLLMMQLCSLGMTTMGNLVEKKKREKRVRVGVGERERAWLSEHTHNSKQRETREPKSPHQMRLFFVCVCVDVCVSKPNHGISAQRQICLVQKSILTKEKKRLRKANNTQHKRVAGCLQFLLASSSLLLLRFLFLFLLWDHGWKPCGECRGGREGARGGEGKVGGAQCSLMSRQQTIPI